MRSRAALALFAILVGAWAAHPRAACARPGQGAPAVAAAAPADLSDVDAWVEYKQRMTIAALPDEAQIFYRRGVQAWRAGREMEALQLVRGAAVLDPSFAAPHRELISHFWARQPSQALVSCASLLEMLKQDFRLQVELVANATFLLLHGLFFGVLVAALLVIALRQGELRHMWRERLSARIGPGAARTWAWVLLVAPWLLGLGLALPALVLLAMLWPVLKARERVLFVTLGALMACAPFAARGMGRLALPMQGERPPYYDVLAVEDEGYSPERQHRLAQLAREHPDNPFVQFGLAWTAREADALPTAEAAYRKTLELWPRNDRVLNNLGNLLAMQGRFPEALERFHAAVTVNPANAGAYFNASQVHTRLFDYASASEALAHASALNFELVRRYQSRSAEDGSLPLIDEWIAPSSFWHALLATERVDVPPVLPPAWRSAIETAAPFSAAALLLTLMALALGLWWQHKVPLRACSNCARVICRRCAKRRREVALCPHCAMVAGRAESSEFAGVLLDQRARHVERIRVSVRTVFAALIPGFGLLAFRRVFGAIALLAFATALVSIRIGIREPFVFEPRVISLGAGHHESRVWVGLGLVYAFSLCAYLNRWAHERRLAPPRSRPAPAPLSTPKAA